MSTGANLKNEVKRTPSSVTVAVCLSVGNEAIAQRLLLSQFGKKINRIVMSEQHNQDTLPLQSTEQTRCVAKCQRTWTG